MEHYDVIIIGTGAGGGTLAHRLAPSGKRILLLERGGYLPREPENWDSHEVFNTQPLPVRRDVDRQGRRASSSPTSSTSSAATRSSTARSCSACASATSARSATTAASRPRGRCRYADLEPYYARGRAALPRARAARARTRPSRGARAPFPYPAVSHEPRIQQLHDDFERTGHRPFHLPVGVDLDESDPEAGRCVRCDRFDGFPCLADGKADAHVLCVRPALQHAERRRCARTRSVERLETDAGGRSVTEVVVDRRGARGALQRRRRRRRRRRGELGRAAAALGERAAPARARQRLRPGRAQLHGPHQLGRDRDLADAERDEVPEDARRQRLLLGRRRTPSCPLGHIQMLGKSDRNILRAGAPWFAPGLALDYMAKHAIDFWLTSEDLPHPDNRVTVDRRGAHPPGQDLPQRGGPPAAAAQAQGRCSASSAATRRIPSATILDQRIPLAGVAHQCGTVRFGEDPATSALDVDCRAHDARQPLRRRHELLPLLERGEPGADRDGQRPARRRPPARAARRRRRGDARQRQARPRAPGDGMTLLDTLATAIGRGPASPASPAPPR